MIRGLAELLAVDDPASDEVRGWIERCPVPVQVLPRDPRGAAETLHRLQVTARSTLGSMAYDCGGLVVDSGWLRLLGGGHPDLPSLADANGWGPPSARPAPSAVLLGWDLLGGCFAIDGGAYGAPHGHVCYFAPDALGWEDLGMGHTAFMTWVLSGALSDFARDLRWPGWEKTAAVTGLGQLVSSSPPPWLVAGRRAEVTRTPVPVAEQLARQAEAAHAEDGAARAPLLPMTGQPGGGSELAARA